MKIAAATTASTVRIFFFIFSLLLFLTKRNLIFFQVIFFCEELLEDRLLHCFFAFSKMSVTDSVFFCLLLHILKSIIDLLQSDLPKNTLLLVVNLEGILFHLAT